MFAEPQMTNPVSEGVSNGHSAMRTSLIAPIRGHNWHAPGLTVIHHHRLAVDVHLLRGEDARLEF
jgi:hypothetical protein